MWPVPGPPFCWDPDRAESYFDRGHSMGVTALSILVSGGAKWGSGTGSRDSLNKWVSQKQLRFPSVRVPPQKQNQQNLWVATFPIGLLSLSKNTISGTTSHADFSVFQVVWVSLIFFFLSFTTLTFKNIHELFLGKTSTWICLSFLLSKWKALTQRGTTAILLIPYVRVFDLLCLMTLMLRGVSERSCACLVIFL